MSLTYTVLEILDLNVWYNSFQALKKVSMNIPGQRVTAIIGPSGCGKSTLIRCINRINELVTDFRLEGRILFNGKDIYEEMDPIEVRLLIGMVFQKPNPFPKSVYENVAYGPRICGIRGRSRLDNIVEESLKRAALWDEVKDKLRQNALTLSGGQQQRLCIARALAVQPEVLLLDEPCSALDPTATSKIEELIHELKKDVTIVIVTHNMQQAARVSDYTGFLSLGELIEFGNTTQIFTNPREKRTEDYLTGRFG